MEEFKGYDEEAVVKFIDREQWAADSLIKTTARYLPLPVRYVLETFTKTETCSNEVECKQRVREIQIDQMNKGYHDIGYSFLIGGDGNVYVGRGWIVEPKRNETYPHLWGLSIEVAHIGPKGEVPFFNNETLESLISYGKTARYLYHDAKIARVYRYEHRVKNGKFDNDYG